MSGGSKTQKTVTKNEISPEERARIRQLTGIANQIEQVDPFTGQRVAGMDPFAQMGQQAALRAIPGINENIAAQQNAVAGLLGGGGVGGQFSGPAAFQGGVSPVTSGVSIPRSNTPNVSVSGGALPQASLPELQQIQSLGAVDENLARSLTAPITRQLREQILPGIGASAVSQGAFGGSRQGLLEGQAASDAAARVAETITNASLGAQQQFANQALAQNQQALGAQNQLFGQQLASQGQGFGQDLAGANLALQQAQQQFGQDLAGAQLGLGAEQQAFGQNLASQQFGQGLQGQAFQQALAGFGANQAADAQRLAAIQAGLGFAPNLNQQSLIGSNILGQIGAQNQAQSQAELDAARQLFNEQQTARNNQLLQQAGVLGSFQAGGGTTTQTQQMPGSSPLQGALGGALTGFSTFGPMGALAGGLLGALG